MKATFLVILGLVASATANASLIRCAEKGEAALKQDRLQYAVFIKELGKITDPVVVGEHDYAVKVRVSLLSRDPSRAGSKFTLDRPSFDAVAKSEDVMYNIHATRRHGFEMGIFMDELDQTWVKLRGVRGSLRMNCIIK